MSRPDSYSDRSDVAGYAGALKTGVGEMPLSLAIPLAIGLVLTAITAWITGVVRALQRRGLGLRRQSFPASLQRDPVVLAALLMIVALFLPWIRGSAVGIGLPATVFGLPWLGAVVATSTGIAIALLFAGHVWPSALMRIGLQTWLVIVTAASSATLVVTALAQRVSHYTFVSDTVLRGLGRSHDVLPVVRVGAGETLFAVAVTVACAASVTMRYVDLSPTALATSPDEMALRVDDNATAPDSVGEEKFEVPWT